VQQSRELLCCTPYVGSRVKYCTGKHGGGYQAFVAQYHCPESSNHNRIEPILNIRDEHTEMRDHKLVLLSSLGEHPFTE
jgi:hypothetical protein